MISFAIGNFGAAAMSGEAVVALQVFWMRFGWMPIG
jgi:hypothetical protein